ncbi:helix-turn-helix domain-containing protein [uncultured Photobacterium sp.]|uniref:AraC family transcriptional regulator n=1 Tax=uncultured Photobacterium sp. TaxID=173973 RepID=UPI0026284055|nr:helix-turn-helix domain-containing protein [uncultured Photobacterium sp.]
MKTWKQAPLSLDIAQWVECYWLLEFAPNDSNRTTPVLLPNPNAHLVITPENTIHHYRYNEDNSVSFTGPHILMPTNRSLTLLDSSNVLRLGVKFRPGAPYGLWGLDGKQILNSSFNNLLHLHPQLHTAHLTSMLTFRADPVETAKHLDLLISRMMEHARIDHYVQLTQKALTLIEQQPTTNIELLLGCSRRTLERAFVKVTGLTIKQYEIMIRLDKLFIFLYQQPNHLLNWAEIAFRFGFSDQPHLIRQLKKTIGTTPGNYLNTRNLIIDIYGDFESPTQAMNNQSIS